MEQQTTSQGFNENANQMESGTSTKISTLTFIIALIGTISLTLLFVFLLTLIG